MIIYRYMAREVLQTTFAVALVLLLIIISARFSSYLADAARGAIDAGVLFTLLGLRVFNFLELILPLSLLIGILLSYGRMYVDSEMTVLFSCGMSQSRLLSYTLRIALVVAVLVGFFSLYLGPMGVKLSAEILAEQRNRTDFEAIQAQKFNLIDGGLGVTYAEAISSDKQVLKSVFVARAHSSEKEGAELIVADSGRTVINSEIGVKFLMLSGGRRYLGNPGDLDFQIIEFDSLSQRLPEPDYEIAARKATDGATTLDLLDSDEPQARAALHWRLSMPVIVLLLSIVAIPLSRTNPRSGRYAKLLPAMLAYVIYLLAANAARESMETGASALSLWSVHLLFFAFSLLLFGGRNLGNWLRSSRSNAATA